MRDVTDATFEQEVLVRSDSVPVVVDLWAQWCGPCRTLGPILERAVAATGGKVDGVKVDIDANPGVAQAFRVQSIPLVVAIKDRKVVSSFLGAQPEHVVRDWVNALLPTEEESEVERLVAAGDESSLRRALELDPDHEGAIALLGELLVSSGRAEEALELIGRIPETPATRRVAALARAGGEIGTADEIQSRLDSLLDRVKADEDARKEFVDLLELLGPDDPRTAVYRKQLAARLY